MRKIAVINYKGGTGKTTTVVNLAHAMSMKGLKILIVDTDPQGSAGVYFGVSGKRTLYDVLIEKEPIETCIESIRYNIDILCSNERVFPAELKMTAMKNRELILKNRLKHVSGYDAVILDCAPSMNLLNQNALLYANEILLPVSMEYLSLIGVKQLLKNIKIINRIFNKKVVITKVIPTFYDKRNKKSKDILGSLKRVFPNMMSTPIRIDSKISESSGKLKTIFEFSPTSSGALDYNTVAEELLDGR